MDRNITVMTESPAETCSRSQETIILLVVTSVMLVAGMAANVVTIVTIAVSKKIRLHDQGMVIGVSISDVVFLGFCFPVIMAVIADCGSWPGDHALCVLQGYVTALSFHAAINNIALIAVVRYVSIAHIASYRNITQPGKIVMLMSLTWILSATIPTPSLLGWGEIHFNYKLDTCLYNWQASLGFTVYIQIFALWLPLVIIIACYIGIFISVTRSRRKVFGVPIVSTSGNQNEDGHVTSTGLTSRERRLALQLLVLVLSFVVSWAPYFLVAWYIDPRGEAAKDVYDITSNLVIAHTVINPLVYFFGNKAFRQEAAVVFSCKKRL